MTFTLPGPNAAQGFGRVPGVTGVQHHGGRTQRSGDRSMIAHVGAELVRGGPVPPDLRVAVPDLEQALLALLDGAGPPIRT